MGRACTEGDLKLQVAGDLHSEARVQNVTATLGDVNVRANDDVKMIGERIRMNCWSLDSSSPIAEPVRSELGCLSEQPMARRLPLPLANASFGIGRLDVAPMAGRRASARGGYRMSRYREEDLVADHDGACLPDRFPR